jgi:hypothetical protein
VRQNLNSAPVLGECEVIRCRAPWVGYPRPVCVGLRHRTPGQGGIHHCSA